MDYRKLRADFLALVASMPNEKLSKAFKEATKIANNDLPVVAPALWTERDDEITAVEFFRRHYLKYASRGLTRAYLYDLDRPLYKALNNWMSRQSTIPVDLKFLIKVKSDTVKEELASEGIKKPQDARRIYRDDPKRSDRLYEAAKRERNKLTIK